MSNHTVGEPDHYSKLRAARLDSDTARPPLTVVLASSPEQTQSLSPEWWRHEHAALEPAMVEIPVTISLGYYETLALKRHFRNPAAAGGVRPFSSLELRLFAVLAVNAAVDAIMDAELTDAEKVESAGA